MRTCGQSSFLIETPQYERERKEFCGMATAKFESCFVVTVEFLVRLSRASDTTVSTRRPREEGFRPVEYVVAVRGPDSVRFWIDLGWSG